MEIASWDQDEYGNKSENKSGYKYDELFMPCITLVLLGTAFWYLMHITSDDLMNLSEDKMY